MYLPVYKDRVVLNGEGGEHFYSRSVSTIDRLSMMDANWLFYTFIPLAIANIVFAILKLVGVKNKIVNIGGIVSFVIVIILMIVITVRTIEQGARY